MTKWKMMSMFAGFSIVVFCGGVLAQTQPPPARPGSPGRDARPDPRMEQAIDMMFQDMDTNRDGKISKKEWLAAQEKHFSNLDRNGDGGVTRDEILSDMKQRMSPPQSEGRRPPQ